MLSVRAPVRISLAGGGTDLPAYYMRHGGFVVSSSINKYFYVFIGLAGTEGIQVSSSDYRVFYRHRAGEAPLWDGDLGLVKAALHEFGFSDGVSLFLASEVPPGTGLGSSSTVAVALVKALSTLLGVALSPAAVAERACTLELDRVGSPIGKQDQYAAAFGGLNAISFASDGVTVRPLAITSDVRERLQHNLLLFFTGATRTANSILVQQQRASLEQRSDTLAALHAIKEAAVETQRCLERGDLTTYGDILAESWEHKKRLTTGISNARIDELYDLARRHGARGGKLAGAGGGGFLMLYCEEPHHAAVSTALEAAGLYRMDFQFDQGGAQVLMNALPSFAWRHPANGKRVTQHV